MIRKHFAKPGIVLALGIVIGHGLHVVTAGADGGQGAAALENGDVNGDGKIDLSAIPSTR